MKIQLTKISLTRQIFIALALAVVVGYLLRDTPETAENYIRP